MMCVTIYKYTNKVIKIYIIRHAILLCKSYSSNLRSINQIQVHNYDAN